MHMEPASLLRKRGDTLRIACGIGITMPQGVLCRQKSAVAHLLFCARACPAGGAGHHCGKKDQQANTASFHQVVLLLQGALVVSQGLSTVELAGQPSNPLAGGFASQATPGRLIFTLPDQVSVRDLPLQLNAALYLSAHGQAHAAVAAPLTLHASDVEPYLSLSATSQLISKTI